MLAGCDDTGGLTGAQLRKAKFAWTGRYVLGPAGNPKNIGPAELESDLAANVCDVLFYETDGQMFTEDDGKAAATAFQARLDVLAKAIGRPDLSKAAGFFAQDLPEASGVTPDAYMKGVASVIGLDRTGGYGDYSTVHDWMDRKLVGALDNGSFLAFQTSGDSAGQWDNRAIIRQTGYGVNVDGVQVDLDYAAFYGSALVLGGGDYYGQWPLPDPPPPPAITRHEASGNETLHEVAMKLSDRVERIGRLTVERADAANGVAMAAYLGGGHWGPLGVRNAGANTKMPKGLVYYT